MSFLALKNALNTNLAKPYRQFKPDMLIVTKSTGGADASVQLYEIGGDAKEIDTYATALGGIEHGIYRLDYNTSDHKWHITANGYSFYNTLTNALATELSWSYTTTVSIFIGLYVTIS